jgi:multiple sugar transport system permease protein
VGVPAGYGLAFGKFPGRRLILSLTLVVMIIPGAALVLPIFLELNAMHLLGRSLSVILPFAFFPFGVYLAYIYYATALPQGLLDAARVDGCSEMQTFLRVALPLAKPVLALVFFFSFVADWNNFFLPLTVLGDSSQYPIQVGLSNLLSSTPSFNPAQGGGGQTVNIFRPELALATLLAIVPVAVVFLLSQRALVRGLVGGAVKE